MPRSIFDSDESRRLDEVTNAYAVLIRWGYHDQAGIVLSIIKVLQDKEKRSEEETQQKFPLPPERR
jgi:hypothetical protein